ncbi:MAG TPA: response regulator [Myxococcales bacterium]|jgi:two-component system chemotaxis sensor kinase CheA|nr:response regulator [Myxococcales bacterium]
MDEILRQVLTLFGEEFREHSLAMAQSLIQADRSDSPEERKALMAEIYRRAHSVKGTSGTLGLFDLEDLAHAVETSLTRFRTGEKALVPGLAQKILDGLDQAQRLLEAVAAGADVSDPVLRATAAELLKLSAGGAGDAPGDAPSPVVTQASPSPASSSPGAAGEPAAAEPAARVDETTARKGAEVVRVSAERLFALERQLDDLREIRAGIEQRAEDARRLFWTLQGALSRAQRHLEYDLASVIRDQILQLQRNISGAAGELSFRVAELDDELRALRMLPVDTLLAPLAKAVFEHASNVGKRVRLETFGAKVALDRRMLQELRDPFVHLVRNAVDHGVETPAERARLGKRDEGVIRIDVEQRGNTVQLTFTDDGNGIDVAAVRHKAIESGLLTAEAAAAMAEEQLQELIFQPGFSTSATVSRTSGRGVGLDVVKENVQKVGGRVSVSSRRGQGSRFAIEVPLTLATQQALLFESSGFALAVQLSSVVKARFVDTTEASRGSVEVDGQLLPLHAMSDLIQLPPSHARPNGFSVVVVRAAERMLAIRVDRLLGEREVVVRPLPPEMLRLRHLSAATPLGDGRLAFILSSRALVESLGSQTSFAGLVEVARKHRVVVADDSITTRSLHRQVLEAAGYHVETAADGEEALRILRSKGADLLVSDIHMPRMDGLTLTRRVRAEPALSLLPVVLVSSLDSDADRQRATDAGASEYLAKGAYQRGELLRLVQSLLPS